MKHDELQEDLARHLRGNTDRMVWTNMQLGPVGSPRPDLFTLNKSFSNFRADCYEIKVSVSDLRHDVTSGKWQSYRKFGHAVWFAFERGLAPLDVVPRECGVILRGDGGTWRAARKPVAQVLDTLPRDAWLKLVMDLHPVTMNGSMRPRPEASQYTAAAIVNKKFGKELADLFSDVQSMEARLRYRRDTLQEAIAALDKDIEQRRAEEKRRSDALIERLNQSLGDLARSLGLVPETATSSDLCAAINQFRNKLRGAGIDGAIAALQTLRGTMPAEVEPTAWSHV